MAGDRLGALEHGRDAARDRDVVVLDQDRVVEAEAVIEAAAAAHRVFLQRAQAGRGLAGAADPRARCARSASTNARGRGRDAGQMAEEIQRRRARRRAPRARRPRWSSARSSPRPRRRRAACAVIVDCRDRACATSARPAAGRRCVPALRATTTARARVPSGTVAVEVTSPARPRSSASARVTAASISSGERKRRGRAGRSCGALRSLRGS